SDAVLLGLAAGALRLVLARPARHYPDDAVRDRAVPAARAPGRPGDAGVWSGAGGEVAHSGRLPVNRAVPLPATWAGFYPADAHYLGWYLHTGGAAVPQFAGLHRHGVPNRGTGPPDRLSTAIRSERRLDHGGAGRDRPGLVPVRHLCQTQLGPVHPIHG